MICNVSLNLSGIFGLLSLCHQVRDMTNAIARDQAHNSIAHTNNVRLKDMLPIEVTTGRKEHCGLSNISYKLLKFMIPMTKLEKLCIKIPGIFLVSY